MTRLPAAVDRHFAVSHTAHSPYDYDGVDGILVTGRSPAGREPIFRDEMRLT